MGRERGREGARGKDRREMVEGEGGERERERERDRTIHIFLSVWCIRR